jgi:hypothetical protein
MRFLLMLVVEAPSARVAKLESFRSGQLQAFLAPPTVALATRFPDQAIFSKHCSDNQKRRKNALGLQREEAG